MKAGIAGAVALVGMLASGVALATDGNDLLKSCKALLAATAKDPQPMNVGDFAQGTCMGVIEGVRTTMMVLNGNLDPELRTCLPPKGITNEQAIRIVVKYLEDNPAKLNEDRGVLTVIAYHQAYPCK